MLQQLRREHMHMRRHVPNTTSRAHLRREKTSETAQGVLAGKRLTPRTEASPNPFVTRETTITPLHTQTAAPAGATLEWKVSAPMGAYLNFHVHIIRHFQRHAIETRKCSAHTVHWVRRDRVTGRAASGRHAVSARRVRAGAGLVPPRPPAALQGQRVPERHSQVRARHQQQVLRL